MRKTTRKFICLGRLPADGCGIVLTVVERRQYEEACEYCELDWQERVRTWRFGRVDAELDQMLET